MNSLNSFKSMNSTRIPFHEFSPKPMSNFSRVQSKADVQFLDELGKVTAFRYPEGSLGSGDFRPHPTPVTPPRSLGPAPHAHVHEGSLAGIFVRRHLALELVSGANFSCKLMFRPGPGDLGEVPGSVSGLKPRKTGPKISSQTEPPSLKRAPGSF